MIKRFALVMIFLASSLAVHARVGETIAECEARYGPVVERVPAKIKDSDHDACVFSKAGITIIAEFKNGKAWKITYRMSGMDDSAVETLLNAEAAEGGWSAPLRLAGQDVRTSNDHQRVAVLTQGKRLEDTATFVFASKACSESNRSDYELKLRQIPELVKQRMVSKPMRDL